MLLHIASSLSGREEGGGGFVDGGCFIVEGVRKNQLFYVEVSQNSVGDAFKVVGGRMSQSIFPLFLFFASPLKNHSTRTEIGVRSGFARDKTPNSLLCMGRFEKRMLLYDRRK